MVYKVSICLFIWGKRGKREKSFGISRIVITRESWRKRHLPKWVTWKERSGTTWQSERSNGFYGVERWTRVSQITRAWCKDVGLICFHLFQDCPVPNARLPSFTNSQTQLFSFRFLFSLQLRQPFANFADSSLEFLKGWF